MISTQKSENSHSLRDVRGGGGELTLPRDVHRSNADFTGTFRFVVERPELRRVHKKDEKYVSVRYVSHAKRARERYF